MIKKALLSEQAPFWLITISILIGLTLPTLIQDGMFMDAMLYTSVSHNLSLGIGTFWFPQFSEHNIAGLTSFHEQPPLVFGIQALFYKIIGDSMYTERLYTFFTMAVTGGLIVYLWRNVFRENEPLKKLAWLPLVLWITIPVCFWSYSNNMHENTMGLFTLCSAIFTIKALEAKKHHYLFLALSGLFIFLATLSKGIPGFFPVAIPVLFWATQKRIYLKKVLIPTFIIILFPGIIYFILFNLPESSESLSTYLFKRALHRINDVPTVDNRFYILWRLFTELIPQLGLSFILFCVAKLKKIPFYNPYLIRKSIFFILIGLAGSAPLMLTLVQKGFYLVPALPFFSIGLSILIAPIISTFVEKQTIKTFPKIVHLLSGLLLIGSIGFAFSKKGQTNRNEKLLHDIHLIAVHVPQKTTISIPSELWNEWDLQCNLIRYYNISLETSYKKDYLISEKISREKIPIEYKKIPIETLKYDLYKRK